MGQFSNLVALVALLALLILSISPAPLAIRFVIDREECLSHNVEYEGDTVHVSFVVIKATLLGITATMALTSSLRGLGETRFMISETRPVRSMSLLFTRKASTAFALPTNLLNFDVQVGHFAYYDQHAKDEHFTPLMEQISKLEEALYNIQFEQHWLEAQTDRQAIVNEGMSKKAVHKAIFESLALIGASFLQVYLLRRLFERKLGMSRV
ncbi:unnamed protein product [Rhodiola kirilowii]